MTDVRPARRSWCRGLVVAVAIGIYGGAVSEAAVVLLLGGPWNWAAAAVRGLGPAIGWGLVFVLQSAGRFPSRAAHRRRTGAPDTAAAIATGRLPPDAEHDRWRPWLELEARELAQERRLTLVLWGSGAALVGAAAVSGHGTVGVVAVAVAITAFGLQLHHRLTGMERTARRLLAELPHRG